MYNFDKVIDRNNTGCIKWDCKQNRSPKAVQDSLALWIADMDFECPKPIVDALNDRANHKIFGYTSSDSKELKDAVMSWYRKKFNWELDRDSICPTAGVVTAIAFLLRILTEENNGVIIQEPVYNPFGEIIRNNNRKVINNELLYKENKYSVNFEDLENKAKDPNNKVMILCSPHNPVGRVWTKEELLKIIQICKDNDIYLICDELHCDLIRKGYKHTPIHTLVEGCKDKIIVCTSPGKTFNISGLHIANIIITNKELRDKWNSQMIGLFGLKNHNPFSVQAAIAGFNECEEWLNNLNNYIDENIEFIKSYLKEKLPKVKLVTPEGTYFAWLDFNEYKLNELELEDLMLTKAKVVLNEGYIFGQSGAGFERVNIACPRATLKECLDRIANALEK